MNRVWRGLLTFWVLFVFLSQTFVQKPAIAQGRQSRRIQAAKSVSLEQYLRETAVPKKALDTFLNPHELNWARFDPELGYVLSTYFPRDGIAGSSTLSTIQANGARTARMYIEKPGRINTYGDSFTQCHQVSDGETWQEYLAAHLAEPVRNFGMGGHGFYQAYRRMLREEQTEHGAEYVVLYIWGDDHTRSLLRCRYPVARVLNNRDAHFFHNNFWAHIEMDLERGHLVEKENLLPTPESLYRMTDPAWMYEALKDDLAVQMYLYLKGSIHEPDWSGLQRLAEILKVAPADGSPIVRSYETVSNLLHEYGFAATRYILEKARKFTDQRGKKLLVVLNDPAVLRSLVESKTRYDQEIVDFLKENSFLNFDMNLVHVGEYESLNIPLDQYRSRYFMPHYNPAGNHFFAYSIKDTIVNWLDPKPLPYRESSKALVDFTGYLFEERSEK